MDITKIKPNYFSTFFMFPFGFEIEGDDVSQQFQNSTKWIAQNYQVKKGIDYNEYVYFYKQVRDVLLQMNQDGQQEGVKFFNYNFENHCLKYNVLNPNINSEPISLKIEEINLHLFEPGVGILIFEIVNDSTTSESKLSLYDYLAFLANGRRVFPPFINPEAEIENGTFKCGFAENDAISKRECAAKITITCGDDTIVEEDYKQNFRLRQYEENGKREILPYLSKVIRYFLDLGDEFSYEQKKYWPIIDDRMFCHSYYSIKGDPKTLNRSFLDHLKRALGSEDPKPYADEAVQIWYQLLFLDLNGPSCANRPFMLHQIKDSSYNRWSGYGTFYGFTRYSSTTISDYDERYLYNHFKTMYYQIAVLLFFYRGALLAFSRKSAEIAAIISERNSNQDKKKAREAKERGKKDVLAEAQKELEELNKDFLLFRNKLWFREVTAQEQGIEMFDIMSKKMRNIELLEDLQSEIRELYSFFDAHQEKQTSKTIHTLTLLGYRAMPLVIATALFGMNFPLNVRSLLNNSSSWGNWGISLIIFLLAVILFRAVFHFLAKLSSKMNIFDYFSTKKRNKKGAKL